MNLCQTQEITYSFQSLLISEPQSEWSGEKAFYRTEQVTFVPEGLMARTNQQLPLNHRLMASSQRTLSSVLGGGTGCSPEGPPDCQAPKLPEGLCTLPGARRSVPAGKVCPNRGITLGRRLTRGCKQDNNHKGKGQGAQRSLVHTGPETCHWVPLAAGPSGHTVCSPPAEGHLAFKLTPSHHTRPSFLRGPWLS